MADEYTRKYMTENSKDFPLQAFPMKEIAPSSPKH
jgi:hypothetical protein